MVRSIRLDEIIVARSDADRAEPLPNGLARKLYNDPIIVRADMVLVDGLRRLLWHREQGHEVAPVVVASTFTEAMDALRPQHQEVRSRLTALRIWNFYSVLLEYARAQTREAKRTGWAKRPDRSSPTPHGPESRIRRAYMQALNVSGHQIQSAAHMYRLVDAGDSRARALVERTEAGEFGITHANRLYRRPHNLGGNVTNRSEQERILERGVAELHAQVSAFQKLGSPIVVTDENLAEAIEGMASARSQLTTIVSGLRKALKERENHG